MLGMAVSSVLLDVVMITTGQAGGQDCDGAVLVRLL